MRRRLVHMQVRGENVKVRIARFKRLEVFVQNSFCKFSVFRYGAHIILVPDLNDDFIKRFFLFSGTDFFIIIFDDSVAAGLLFVVLLQRLIEQFVIRVLYFFFPVGNVQMRSCGVRIRRVELAFIVIC